MTSTPTFAPTRPDARKYGALVGSLYAGNARSVMSRGLLATKSTNYLVVLSGFFEPIFYLLSMGIAPALLTGSAMNGAVYDSTWNVFFKMNYSKLYEGMLATSLGPLDVAFGEISLALLRGAAYAAGFMIVMQALGLNLSWTALLALPAVMLIAFGFASLGMAITSYMKTFQQMDWIAFVLLPMFLFSATFFPISVYPESIQLVIQALPLWHGVELVRGLTTGVFSITMAWHVLYYVVMIAVGMVFTTFRLRKLFLD